MRIRTTFFPGLVKGVTLDGKLFAVPFRHASTGLHYNEEIFAERGIKGPPQTMEELVEVAKKCTYTRADGTPVIGMILPGVAYPEVIAVARAWDADFITPDMKVVANSKAMVAALTTIRDLYTAGAIPRNLTGMKAEDANTWMQNRTGSDGREFHEPQRPLQRSGEVARWRAKSRRPFSPSRRSSRENTKSRLRRSNSGAWQFQTIRSGTRLGLYQVHVGEEGILAAALNGNGPVRNSTYDDPRIKAELPYSEDERKVLKVSRVPLPAFDNAARAANSSKRKRKRPYSE